MNAQTAHRLVEDQNRHAGPHECTYAHIATCLLLTPLAAFIIVFPAMEIYESASGGERLRWRGFVAIDGVFFLVSPLCCWAVHACFCLCCGQQRNEENAQQRQKQLCKLPDGGVLICFALYMVAWLIAATQMSSSIPLEGVFLAAYIKNWILLAAFVIGGASELCVRWRIFSCCSQLRAEQYENV